MPRVEGYRTGRLENIIGKHMSELNFGLEERILNSKDELAQREALLTSRGLMVPEGEELVLGLFVGEQLVATGALVRNVLQGIAVDIDYEGEGISAAIVSSLIRRAVDRGITQVFLYTISEDISRFESLGFRKVAAVPRGAALLEWGTAGIESYLASIRALAKDKPDHAGAV
ncbi:MAG: GNAT family N-acetyltransferase, partial [Rectinema sp.]